MLFRMCAHVLIPRKAYRYRKPHEGCTCKTNSWPIALRRAQALTCNLRNWLCGTAAGQTTRHNLSNNKHMAWPDMLPRQHLNSALYPCHTQEPCIASCMMYEGSTSLWFFRRWCRARPMFFKQVCASVTGMPRRLCHQRCVRNTTTSPRVPSS